MKTNNYFKLNIVHPVIKDFVEDHTKSLNTYQKTASFVKENSIDDMLEKNDPIALGFELYSIFSEHLEEMKQSYYNFFMSYYTFKKEAETNPEVKEEFIKLPETFNDVKTTFTNIINGYEHVLEELKEKLI